MVLQLGLLCLCGARLRLAVPPQLVVASRDTLPAYGRMIFAGVVCKDTSSQASS